MREYPFQHVFVENVFPDDYYQLLQDKLPPTTGYECIGNSDRVGAGQFKSRFITDIKDLKKRGVPDDTVKFWEDLMHGMLTERFLRTTLYKFANAYKSRFSTAGNKHFKFFPELRLVRDFESYKITPHTDQPKKVVSLLFYLPKDASQRHLGTSLYIPKDPNLKCLGGPHHKGMYFKKVFTAPFIPNSCLMFIKTDQCFHGVEVIEDMDVERNVLLYNVYCDPVPEQLGNNTQGITADAY